MGTPGLTGLLWILIELIHVKYLEQYLTQSFLLINVSYCYFYCSFSLSLFRCFEKYCTFQCIFNVCTYCSVTQYLKLKRIVSVAYRGLNIHWMIWSLLAKCHLNWVTFFLTGGKEKDFNLNESKLFYFIRPCQDTYSSFRILSGKRPPPMNLPLVYLYLAHVGQLGPSWGMDKKEVGDGMGRRMDAAFSFVFRKNNGPKRSDLVSF